MAGVDLFSDFMSGFKGGQYIEQAFEDGAADKTEKDVRSSERAKGDAKAPPGTSTSKDSGGGGGSSSGPSTKFDIASDSSASVDTQDTKGDVGAPQAPAGTTDFWKGTTPPASATQQGPAGSTEYWKGTPSGPTGYTTPGDTTAQQPGAGQMPSFMSAGGAKQDMFHDYSDIHNAVVGAPPVDSQGKEIKSQDQQVATPAPGGEGGAKSVVDQATAKLDQGPKPSTVQYSEYASYVKSSEQELGLLQKIRDAQYAAGHLRAGREKDAEITTKQREIDSHRTNLLNQQAKIMDEAGGILRSFITATDTDRSPENVLAEFNKAKVAMQSQLAYDADLQPHYKTDPATGKQVLDVDRTRQDAKAFYERTITGKQAATTQQAILKDATNNRRLDITERNMNISNSLKIAALDLKNRAFDEKKTTDLLTTQKNAIDETIKELRDFDGPAADRAKMYSRLESMQTQYASMQADFKAQAKRDGAKYTYVEPTISTVNPYTSGAAQVATNKPSDTAVAAPAAKPGAPAASTTTTQAKPAATAAAPSASNLSPTEKTWVEKAKQLNPSMSEADVIAWGVKNNKIKGTSPAKEAPKAEAPKAAAPKAEPKPMSIDDNIKSLEKQAKVLQRRIDPKAAEASDIASQAKSSSEFYGKTVPEATTKVAKNVASATKEFFTGEKQRAADKKQLEEILAKIEELKKQKEGN